MKRIFGISLILLTGFLFSCQNDKISVTTDEELVEKSAVISLTEANLEAIATTADYEVEFYANAEEHLTRMMHWGKKWMWTNKLHYMANHCPNVTIETGDNNGYPKTVKLDYGEGTEMKNDKVLKGIIIVEISGPRNSESYTRKITYDNFAVDTVQIGGTALIEVNKANETFRSYSSDLTFTITGTVVQNVITRSSNRNWTWIEGMTTTDDQTDDVIHIDGEVNASNGTDTYKKEIIEPLVRVGDCKFIVQGIVKITVNTAITTLNYGEGECDSVAILTNADGTTSEVDLAKYKRKEYQKGNKNNFRKG